MKKHEIDTPALLLDLRQLKKNLEKMRDLAMRSGKKLRPHAKTHKCPALARLQLSCGNCAGVCAAKVSEAEVLAANKIDSILITSPVVSAAKIRRLVELNRSIGELLVVVDNMENVDALDRAFSGGKKLKVLIDVDPEMGRTGVKFSEAVNFGKMVNSRANLQLVGVQCYCGHLQHIRECEARKSRDTAFLKKAAEIFRQLQADGIGVNILTGVGTGTFEFALEIPEITDIQVGSYCMMDVEYSAIETTRSTMSELFPAALTMLAGVIDVNQPDFVTIDAGTKALYVTPDAPPAILRDGRVAAEWRYDWSFGDEHGKVYFPTGAKPRLGSTLELLVSHCDPTVNLFDKLYVVDGDEVVDVWEIALRGCCR